PGSEQPPGHWNMFAQLVAQRNHYDLDTNVKLFFILSNAIFDAGIAAWDCKLCYNSVRPVTAIHYLFKNKQVKAWAGPYKGTQWIKGQDWLPYQAATVVTPAFPEHVSGHSAFSASAAAVLRHFTGSDIFGFSHTIKAKDSLFEPGQVPTQDVTLSYPTFSSAADEAGLSRRYGGIHFERGDLMGRTMGRLVAQQAWNKALAYIHGTT
ncbi:MAG: vanadium-dependent haloperoxidase, partial [Ktedonobacteraceae bacterium]|nr:vanadium-dependent haloperoxidase [Ktedonobacteraceae bacterium]